MGRLLTPEQREAYVAEVREEYEALRERRAGRGAKSELLPIDEARARAFRTDWAAQEPTRPARPGIHELSVPVAELRPLIDWTPFFAAWELKGKFPDILDDDTVGEQARELLADAEALLDRIEAEGLLDPRAVVGLFPAASTGDDVLLYADEERAEVRATIHGLRQQFGKEGRENLCLSDYVAPEGSGVADWSGAFAVTAGRGLDGYIAEQEAAHDDYQAILAKSVADRLAEALAEWAHRHVRTELWGYAPREALSNDDLIGEAYRGIRPAPGYPACPDHTEKRILFDLLDAEERLEMALTESCAMDPPASVSGWYFAHPSARYFGVGRIGRDQVEDYAERKGMSVAEVERWLAPSLGYDPEKAESGRRERAAGAPRGGNGRARRNGEGAEEGATATDRAAAGTGAGGAERAR
jgi:5-methyltetrahydrofolate--homocysteine methyltransferase